MNSILRYVGRWEVFLLVVLVATFTVGAQVSQYFLTSSNVSISLASVAPLAIMALPMTLIIITGEIDISVGSMIGLCSATIAVCLEQGLPVELAMLFGIFAGALAGSINGAFVVYGGLPSLVVTIGTLALFRGVALIILEERGVTGFPDWYQEIGFGTVGGTPIPWSSLIFIACFLGFAVFLHLTHGGRALYAIGNNRRATSFSGVNVNRALFGVFVASGVMAGVAAIVLTAFLASARADTAIGLELNVITAVVLGGVNIFGGSGTLFGVLIAVLVLAFVRNALGLAGVTPEAQQVVTGAVLVTTLIVFGGADTLRNLRARLTRLRGGES